MKKTFQHSMKIIYVLIILVFGFGLTACDRDDNRIPSALVGSWEMTALNTHLELDFALTYTFNANGTYTQTSTAREVGKSEVLGYSFFSSGNYRVEDDRIIFALKDHLHKPYGATEPFYTKDELVKGEIDINSEGSQAFEIRTNGQELFFPGGTSGGDIMMPDQTFMRVE